jgi:phage/plasmid primase-like uncharacterized protein
LPVASLRCWPRVVSPDGQGCVPAPDLPAGRPQGARGISEEAHAGLAAPGAAIRLTAVSEVLGIAEGIETALAAFELFEVPVWSGISAQGIESFEPPAGVREVIVFADHDENFAGQAAAYRAAHRLTLKGFEVEVVDSAGTG